jgi:phage terminase large subunit-like protein
MGNSIGGQMNGQLKWILSVAAALVVMWLGWTSQTTMTHSTAIAVLQSQFNEIRSNMIEIKDMVKDIRQDQQRRELKEPR